MVGIAIRHYQVARGDCARDKERACLDAIGMDAIARAMQAGDSLDADRGCASAFDPRAHRGEKGSEISDFGLARAVLHKGFPFGKDCGHEEVFSSGNRDFVEDDVGAFELARARLEVAVFLRDGCAHFLKALDMEVDGTATDRASAGHCDTSYTRARNEGSENEGTGA